MTDIVRKLRAAPDDQAAWTEFFRKLYPRVFYLLFWLTRGNRTTAEELSQEAFARFVRYGGLSKVEDEESAAAFLRMTARNSYLTSLRGGQGRTESLEGPGDHQQREIGADLVPLEDIIDFERAYKKLDTEERRLLNLCVEGYSLKEIAEHMGTSYSAAAVRLHRLRRRLREGRRLR